MKDLIIILDKIKYKIELNYKDLFTTIGDYVYFNVLFTQDEDDFKNDFILGKPVFKKYPLVFNLVRRNEKIGFYNNFSYNKNEQNKDINNTEKNQNGGGKKERNSNGIKDFEDCHSAWNCPADYFSVYGTILHIRQSEQISEI